MDKRLTSAGGRTPSPALSAPSPFVLEARGGSHCEALGRTVTGFSGLVFNILRMMQEFFRKALHTPYTYKWQLGENHPKLTSIAVYYILLLVILCIGFEEFVICNDCKWGRCGVGWLIISGVCICRCVGLEQWNTHNGLSSCLERGSPLFFLFVYSFWFLVLMECALACTFTMLMTCLNPCSNGRCSWRTMKQKTDIFNEVS